MSAPRVYHFWFRGQSVERKARLVLNPQNHGIITISVKKGQNPEHTVSGPFDCSFIPRSEIGDFFRREMMLQLTAQLIGG